MAFPYPAVSITPKAKTDIVDNLAARNATVNHLFSAPIYDELKKNNTYRTSDLAKGYILLTSKNYPEGDNEKYWFGYRKSRFDKISDCNEQRFILICRDKHVFVLDIPRSYIDTLKIYMNSSLDDAGNIKHYHIVVHRSPDGKVTLLLSKPTPKRIDISNYIVDEL